jgi:cell division protein ZapA
MAEVTLSVGGYNYQLACRNGEEAHLVRLGEIVDAKVQEARAAIGNASEVRQLLLSALLFADEMLDPAQAQPAASSAELGIDAEKLEQLANKAEAIAARLEKSTDNA